MWRSVWAVTLLVGCKSSSQLHDAGGDDGALEDAAPDAPDPMITGAETYLKPMPTAAGDSFGVVALSGDGQTLVVGAQNVDTTKEDAGAAYVFVRQNNAWVQQAQLVASNPSVQSRFGFSTAISGDGNVVAIAAINDPSCATGVNGDQANTACGGAGAAYVFVRANGAWTQEAYIKASNAHGGYQFGVAVALSADGATLAVGQPVDPSRQKGIGPSSDDESGQTVGSVCVFVRTGTTWAQQVYLKASNAESGDVFGASLALSPDGDDLAVGAPGESSRAKGVDGDQLNNDMRESGAVYLFHRTGAMWAQRHYIKASNPDVFDDFGRTIAISADVRTLAVGAGAESSAAVGINGDQLDNSQLQAGAVYVFTATDDAWSQQAYLKADRSHNGDRFGTWVSVSGNGDLVAIGAATESGAPLPGEIAQTGAAYVFRREGGVWSRQNRIKASNAGFPDLFGFTVSLSRDGGTLAVGATREASAGPPADNSAADSGAAYVFQ